jgi:hypothetical protein
MSYVLKQSVTTLNGGATQTATYASAQTAGNFNAALVNFFTNTSLTPTITSVKDSKNNGVSATYQVQAGASTNDGQGSRAAVYSAGNIVAAGAGTNIVTCVSQADTTFGNFTISEFSGVATCSDPSDGAKSAFQNIGATTLPTTTIPTSTVSDLVLSTCTGDNGQTAAGTVSGVTATSFALNGNPIVQQWGVGKSTSVVVNAHSTDDAWIIAAAAFRGAGFGSSPYFGGD